MKRKIIAILVWLVVFSLIIPAVGMNALGAKGGNGNGKGNGKAKNNYLIVESSASGVSDGAVRIRSSNGKIQWEMTGLTTPCEAEMLTSGNILIAETYAMRVIEVDPLGTIVNTVSNEAIYGITVLDDGNYLLAGLDGVWEVTSTGSVVWSHPMHWAYDAVKLSDGSYVITDFTDDRLIQVNPETHVETVIFNDLLDPTDVDLLENGNYLVSDYNNRRTIEVNPGPPGFIYWYYNTAGSVHDSDRLPSGNNLITDAHAGKVFEITPQGKRVWQLKNLQYPMNIDILPA